MHLQQYKIFQNQNNIQHDTLLDTVLSKFNQKQKKQQNNNLFSKYINNTQQYLVQLSQNAQNKINSSINLTQIKSFKQRKISGQIQYQNKHNKINININQFGNQFNNIQVQYFNGQNNMINYSEIKLNQMFVSNYLKQISQKIQHTVLQQLYTNIVINFERQIKCQIRKQYILVNIDTLRKEINKCLVFINSKTLQSLLLDVQNVFSISKNVITLPEQQQQFIGSNIMVPVSFYKMQLQSSLQLNNTEQEIQLQLFYYDKLQHISQEEQKKHNTPPSSNEVESKQQQITGKFQKIIQKCKNLIKKHYILQLQYHFETFQSALLTQSIKFHNKLCFKIKKQTNNNVYLGQLTTVNNLRREVCIMNSGQVISNLSYLTFDLIKYIFKYCKILQKLETKNDFFKNILNKGNNIIINNIKLIVGNQFIKTKQISNNLFFGIGGDDIQVLVQNGVINFNYGSL